jgi:hypothetical protein
VFSFSLSSEFLFLPAWAGGVCRSKKSVLLAAFLFAAFFLATFFFAALRLCGNTADSHELPIEKRRAFPQSRKVAKKTA